MIKAIVNLNSIDKVKKFNKLACDTRLEVDLVSGRYTIDAKSIMGIFSLDLSKPIELNVHTNSEEDEIEAAAYLDTIAMFLV